MRIVFCIFKYFPYGGIQRDLMKVVGEVRRRGHDVEIYALRWQAPLPEDLKVHVLPIEGLHRHAQYDHFANEVNVRMRADPPDLLVGFNKMPGLDMYYAGDSCYIAKAHSQRSVWYRLLPRYKSFVRAEREVYSEYSRTEIVTLSRVEVPLYRHHYRTPPERFHAVPPGIERDRVAPPDREARRQAFRQELGIEDDQLMVLFIGSGFIKKGLDRALLAVAALPRPLRNRVRMFVIGRDKAEAFERLAMRLGILQQVTFFAEGRDDVPSFLFAGDALLHPAYDETAGMVIIEGMLAGLPVLATRNCGYAHYLKDFNTGIVLGQPFSQEALNAALNELLTSDERGEWISNGLQAGRCEELFQLVPMTADLIERFARERRPVLVFCLFRYFAFGGLQRDFMRIALACQNAGYDIHVFCLEWFGDRPEGFTVETVEAEGMVNHARYAKLAAHVQARAHWLRPALVIGFNKMPGLDLYYAADPCFEYKARHMRSLLYRSTRRYRLMAAYERAVFGADSDTHILLIAEAQREQYLAMYDTPEQRMSMLPPGVSEDRRRGDQWRQQRAAVRQEFGIGDDECLLLLLGSGFITKGLDRAVEALAALPEAIKQNTRLLVVGQDDPDQFQRLAARLGVADRFFVVAGRDDVPALLQGADLMIHPAYMESGGLVLIEAVIAGLPVICSGVCGFAHHVESAGCGVVMDEPFDQQEFNRQVADALADTARRQTWSENGVQYGQHNRDLYDMPAHALREIEACVETLVSRRSHALPAPDSDDTATRAAG